MKLSNYLDGAAGTAFFGFPGRTHQPNFTRARTLMLDAQTQADSLAEREFLAELDAQVANHWAYCIGSLVMYLVLCAGVLATVYLIVKTSVPGSFAVLPCVLAVALRGAAEIRYRRRHQPGRADATPQL